MTEYRVWCEDGDLLLVTNDFTEADHRLRQLRSECEEFNDCDDSSCGVMNEHGYFIQEVEV